MAPAFCILNPYNHTAVLVKEYAGFGSHLQEPLYACVCPIIHTPSRTQKHKFLEILSTVSNSILAADSIRVDWNCQTSHNCTVTETPLACCSVLTS
jgi:hypothetical protein